MAGAIPASGYGGVPSGQIWISIGFKKAASAYSGSSERLRPGECAWRDRVINNSEPDNLRFKFNASLRVLFRSKDRESFIFENIGSGGNREVYNIMRTLMEGDYFWFEATNANASRYNYFNARNFGAGRPGTGSVRVR